MNKEMIKWAIVGMILGTGLQSQANDFLGMHLDCPAVSNECMEIEFFGKEAEKIIVKKDPEMILGPGELSDAYMSFGQYGQDELTLGLNPEATEKFKQLTSQNVGRRLVVVAHQKALIAPVVQVPIKDGRMVITAGADRDYKFLDGLPWLKKMTEDKKEASQKRNMVSVLVYVALALLVLGGSIYFVFMRKTKA